jgi:hypothetical protein
MVYMKTASVLLGICLQTIAQAGSIGSSQAFDLVGAWTADTSVCAKLFTKTAKAISFKRDSADHGTGFIVAGNVIRGPRTKCTIKSKKESGPETTLLASCASDIMVDQIQFNFKVVDDNTILRQFPGMESLGTSFARCPL